MQLCKVAGSSSSSSAACFLLEFREPLQVNHSCKRIRIWVQKLLHKKTQIMPWLRLQGYGSPILTAVHGCVLFISLSLHLSALRMTSATVIDSVIGVKKPHLWLDLLSFFLSGGMVWIPCFCNIWFSWLSLVCHLLVEDWLTGYFCARFYWG